MHSIVKPVSGLSTLALLGASLVGTVGVVFGPGAVAVAQTLEIAQTSGAQDEPNTVRPGNISSTILSVEGASQVMAEAEAAIANQDFATAEVKLKSAREILNQISNYYQELSEMFIGVDTLITRSNRDQALEAAQMRDQASYQLALVYRAQNKPDLAVPLLMEILRSQQPTRDLGQRAYQQLFEIGFVSEPYAGRAATSPDSEESPASEENAESGATTP